MKFFRWWFSWRNSNDLEIADIIVSPIHALIFFGYLKNSNKVSQDERHWIFPIHEFRDFVILYLFQYFSHFAAIIFFLELDKYSFLLNLPKMMADFSRFDVYLMRHKHNWIYCHTTSDCYNSTRDKFHRNKYPTTLPIGIPRLCLSLYRTIRIEKMNFIEISSSFVKQPIYGFAPIWQFYWWFIRLRCYEIAVCRKVSIRHTLNNTITFVNYICEMVSSSRFAAVYHIQCTRPREAKTFFVVLVFQLKIVAQNTAVQTSRTINVSHTHAHISTGTAPMGMYLMHVKCIRWVKSVSGYELLKPEK